MEWFGARWNLVNLAGAALLGLYPLIHALG